MLNVRCLSIDASQRLLLGGSVLEADGHSSPFWDKCVLDSQL
ncbi:hypothetical protein [uncultured Alteromonas sp.]